MLQEEEGYQLPDETQNMMKEEEEMVKMMTEEEEMVTVSNDIILGMFCLFLAISIILSNMLLMVALWRLRKRRLNTHILVMCLAANDLIVGLLVIPSLLPSLFTKRQLTLPDGLCTIFGVLTSVTVTMSVLMVMCLTLDRFIAVKCPIQYPRICTRLRVLGVAAFTWGEALLFSAIPLLPVFGGYRFKKSICLCIKRIGENKSSSFSIFYYSLCVVIPLASVIVFGSAIIYQLLKKPRLSARAHLRRIRAACITTLLIVGAYILCVMPYTFTFLYKNIAPDQLKTSIDTWSIYCLIATYCNSLLNPIIYVCRSSRMRKEFKLVVIKSSTFCSDRIEF